MCNEYECVCCGNWRAIIKENDSMLNKKYTDKSGVLFVFVGVLWAEDDFYYLMLCPSTKQYHFVSCVMTLETAEYVLCE